MKHLITFAAIVSAFASFAATHLLRAGLNRVNDFGEIAAVEAATVSATASVGVKQVVEITDFTNAFRDVVSAHTRYSFSVTNFDGGASVATNTVDGFAYADWLWTNGESRIVGEVVPSRFSLTNSVPDGLRPGAVYRVTNDIATVATEGHFGATAVTNAFFLDGLLLVTGATNDDDRVTVLVK